MKEKKLACGNCQSNAWMVFVRTGPKGARVTRLVCQGCNKEEHIRPKLRPVGSPKCDMETDDANAD